VQLHPEVRFIPAAESGTGGDREHNGGAMRVTTGAPLVLPADTIACLCLPFVYPTTPRGEQSDLGFGGTAHYRRKDTEDSLCACTPPRATTTLTHHPAGFPFAALETDGVAHGGSGGDPGGDMVGLERWTGEGEQPTGGRSAVVLQTAPAWPYRAVLVGGSLLSSCIITPRRG